MIELSRKDRELIKLRAARMSARSIAGLMGRGWTEARVVSRFAAIDASEAGEEAPLEPVTSAAVAGPQPQEPGAAAEIAPAPRTRPGPRAPGPEAVTILAQPAAPPAVRAPSGTTIRLRPVTDQIIGFAARFVAARWPLDEIAELFDVSPEQLEKVLA